MALEGKRGRTERLRGRKGVEQRKRRLMAEPLCRHCAERGETTPAAEVDHIVPLAFGGEDADENTQSLCSECHAIKSATEGAARGGVLNHPDWLKPSAIPLTIVSGPPCAGKTTFISEHAASGDIVIDLDSIAAKLDPSYRHWEGRLHSTLLDQSIRVRNEMLGSLSRKHRGRAWFVVAAPTKAERDWWKWSWSSPGFVDTNRLSSESV